MLFGLYGVLNGSFSGGSAVQATWSVSHASQMLVPWADFTSFKCSSLVSLCISYESYCGLPDVSGHDRSWNIRRKYWLYYTYTQTVSNSLTSVSVWDAECLSLVVEHSKCAFLHLCCTTSIVSALLYPLLLM